MANKTIWNEPLRLVGMLVFMIGMTSCCQFQPGGYRFQAAFQNEVEAYRNGYQGPGDLVVLVVLQNMGDKDILLAPAKGSGGGSSSEGLYVSAELGSAGGPFPFKIVDKDLEPAVGGGGCLKAFASANRKWLFDTRDHQVEKLATGAEAVLGKNADGYRSALRLNANQALFRLRMKINWKSVPEASPPPNASGVAQRYFLPIQLHFRYVDHDGKTISFVSSADPLGYTVTCILVNASEYPNTLPAVGGPVDGVLQ